MYNNSQNYLPIRETIFVERPFGKNMTKIQTILTMIKRRNKVIKVLNQDKKLIQLKNYCNEASLELFSARTAKYLKEFTLAILKFII